MQVTGKPQPAVLPLLLFSLSGPLTLSVAGEESWQYRLCSRRKYLCTYDTSACKSFLNSQLYASPSHGVDPGARSTSALAIFPCQGKEGLADGQCDPLRAGPALKRTASSLGRVCLRR